MAVLNKTRNGNLIYCSKCEAYHIEFGNLFFKLSKTELEAFTNYINSIDGAYYDHLNQHTTTRRRIMLPTKLKGISFAMHLEELNEFKILLNYEKIHTHKCNQQNFTQIHWDFSPN